MTILAIHRIYARFPLIYMTEMPIEGPAASSYERGCLLIAYAQAPSHFVETQGASIAGGADVYNSRVRYCVVSNRLTEDGVIWAGLVNPLGSRNMKRLCDRCVEP